MTSKQFVKVAANGAFVREASQFRNWIQRSAAAAFPAGPSRPSLLFSLAVSCF